MNVLCYEKTYWMGVAIMYERSQFIYWMELHWYMHVLFVRCFHIRATGPGPFNGNNIWTVSVFDISCIGTNRHLWSDYMLWTLSVYLWIHISEESTYVTIILWTFLRCMSKIHTPVVRMAIIYERSFFVYFRL